ncbi:MAG: phosphoglucosamine mutase [Oligoflexia bacterium]|nr:phosphoglucosamine mutase [Oligoflexia bacterium]
MSERKKLFGTDGIRGTANQFPMTTEIAMQVGRSIAYKVKTEKPGAKDKKPKILIGKDTRLSGYMIEQALSSGINSMGVNVFLVGPLPTPGIAFLTQNMRADAGVVISASHNLFQDNGIKIFGRDGFKLPTSEEKKLEDLIWNGDLSGRLPTAEGVGKTTRIDDAIGRYVVYVKNTFPKELTLQGLRIVLDCANGAAYKVAPWVFEELGAEVVKLGVSPNGLNINDKCGALYPEGVSRAVLEYRADIGISLDGDADRVILSDETGRIVNGDHVLAICAADMYEKGQLEKNTVVATHMSNVGLDIFLKTKGIKLIYTDVGDKYVVDQLRQGGYVLGGEQSGHTIFMENSTTGDGLVAALRVLAVMAQSRRPLSELRSLMQDVPQVLRNIRVSKRKKLEDIPGLKQMVNAIETKLSDQGRVFLRFSGTEPVVRILVEGPNREEIDTAAEELAQLLHRELA